MLDHIQLKNVGKSFASSGKILEDINFTIPQGDFVVLLGPSGSGKSTLLRIIAGLEEVSSGNITFTEKNKFEKAFVFQEPHLMPWRTLRQNVELPLELMHTAKTERTRRSTEALAAVGLAEAADLYPAELSGGMKMRGSLARALAVQPQILLLDEPFAALDETTRFKLGEDLRALWFEKKMTVIFVTHSVQEACFLSERILALENKKIKREIKIELPAFRTNSLRTETIFTEQLKNIYRHLA
jgi:NitT/TauT family transport system ATP-binding protein